MTATAKKMLSVSLAFVLVFTLSPTVAFGGNEGEGEGGTDEVVLQTSSTDENADEADTFVVNDTLLPEAVEEDDPQEDDVVVDEAAVVGEDEEESDDPADETQDAKADEQSMLMIASDGTLTEASAQAPTQSGNKFTTYNQTKNEHYYFECYPCSYTAEGGESKTGVAITGIYTDQSGADVSIPSKITNDSQTYDVVALGLNDTFSWGTDSGWSQNFGTVTIPNSVKFVSSKVVFGNKVQTKVEFQSGSSITELHYQAFYQFAGSSVALPDSLVTVSAEMFRDSKITAISLPTSVTEIQQNAFQSTGQLATVALNEGLQTIGIEAFAPYQREQHDISTSDIPQFTSITIPASVMTISDKAFYKNNNLTEVKFADNSTLTTIGNYAFSGTGLTSVSIPDSVTSIGFAAFSGRNSTNGIDSDDYGSNTDTSRGAFTLTSVTFGSNSRLTTLGARAFARQPIMSVVLPSGLTSLGYDKDTYIFDGYGNMMFFYGTNGSKIENTSLIKLGAFAGCAQLASITWPTGGGLKTVGGFNDCTSLPADAVNSLPSSVTRIDDYAFYNCTAMDNVQVPNSVTNIGKGAFSKPSNVTSTGKTFTLLRGDVTLEGWTADDPTTGPWPLGCGYAINYPLSAANDSSIVKYREAVEKYEEDNNVPVDKRTKFSVSVGEYKKVTGTVPEGASVTLTIGSDETQPELDGSNSFSTWAESGKYVSATISMDGYADYLIAPGPSEDKNIVFQPSALTRDWTFTVSASDMTPRSQLGTLQVTTTGDYNQNCNVAVFEHGTGRLVSQGNVLRIRAYIVDDIPAGTYDVVGWQENDYFKRISSLEDFALMGFGTGDYAKTTVNVQAREAKEITLEIPRLDTSKISGVLATGEVYVPSLYTPPAVPFVAIVKYDMTTGQSVDSVQVNIPKGMRPTAAATTSKDYGIGGWTAPDTGEKTTGVLTISGLAEADRQSGQISVALVADDPGSYAISASLASGSITGPIGSTRVECPEIQLVLPEGSLKSSTFTAHVYAVPNSNVELKIGSTVLSVADGTLNKACKTNLVGHAAVDVTIPEGELSASPYYQVTATLSDATADSDGNKPSDTGIVEYNAALQDIPFEPTVHDFWFESAGVQVDLAKAGKDLSGGWYTVVPSAVTHPKIFSRIWPFTASFDSLQPLEDETTLYLGMLDNSVRTFTMSLSGTEDLESGAKRYTYRVLAELSEDDEFDYSEIPCRFDVMPDLMISSTTVQPEFTTANMDALNIAISAECKKAYEAGKSGFQKWLDTFSTTYGNNADAFKKCVDGSYWATLNDTELGGFDLYAADTNGNPANTKYDYATGVFNESFRHEVWDPDSKIWNTLTDEQKTTMVAGENAVADAYDMVALMLGNSKPLYAYGSFEEYLAAEYGYSANGSYDPEQLAQSGYTVIYDEAGNFTWPSRDVVTYELNTPSEGDWSYTTTTTPGPTSSSPSWYAVNLQIPDDEQSSALSVASTQDEPVLTTMGAGDPGNGSSGSVQTKSSWGDDLERFLINFARAGDESAGAFNDAIGTSLDAAGFAANGLGPKAGGFITRGIFSAASMYWTFKSSYDSRASYDAVNAEYKTRVAELERLKDMRKYYEDRRHGGAKTPCQESIEQEIALMEPYISQLNRARWIAGISGTTSAFFGGVGAGAGLAAEGFLAATTVFAKAKKAHTAGVCMREAAICGAVSTGAAVGSILNMAASYSADALLNSELGKYKSAITNWRYWRTQDCKDDDFGQLHYYKKPGIDPSGWTYEAVKDNRVEGVLATIYQKIGDDWMVWDAAEYDQENPQHTTEGGGLFAWDVPTGDWKVLFQKAGYLDKWSDVMHVLPQWVNVAINMLREDAPEVASTAGNDDDPYAPYVDITFNQYMNASDGAMPTVAVNGAAVTGAYWVDVVTGTVVTEADTEDEDAKVSLVLRVPLAGAAEPGDTVTVAIDGAYSYTGVQLAEPYTASITIPDSATYYYVEPEETVTYTKGSNEAHSFTFKRSAYDERTFPRFQGILVDGSAVDASNYTAVAGSVVVTLKAAYLETLAEGDHTLTAQFADGSATADFKVAATKAAKTRAATPSTGDRTAPMNALLLTAAIACVVMLVARNRANAHKPAGKHTRR